MYQETKMLPEWMVAVPHDLPFRQHFLDLALPSIGLVFRGCGNAESNVSVPLVEGWIAHLLFGHEGNIIEIELQGFGSRRNDA